ncbi:unnamed protein product [Prorocentrum cordatum]|uniref:Endonuclease/exonuclease/phosphatase domain-containing protein n=1 Tax=Prorocentrum cordatum TaxID=2364126 RepID=A0ABN9RP90_9DINO|nr:unnamed protein product [Polarella glacialis]
MPKHIHGHLKPSRRACSRTHATGSLELHAPHVEELEAQAAGLREAERAARPLDRRLQSAMDTVRNRDAAAQKAQEAAQAARAAAEAARLAAEEADAHAAQAIADQHAAQQTLQAVQAEAAAARDAAGTTAAAAGLDGAFAALAAACAALQAPGQAAGAGALVQQLRGALLAPGGAGHAGPAGGAGAAAGPGGGSGHPGGGAAGAPADAGMPAAAGPPPPCDARAAAAPGGSRRRAASVGARSRWSSPLRGSSEDGDRSRSTDRGGSPEPRVPLFAQPAQLAPGQRTLPLRRCARLAAAARGYLAVPDGATSAQPPPDAPQQPARAGERWCGAPGRANCELRMRRGAACAAAAIPGARAAEPMEGRQGWRGAAPGAALPAAPQATHPLLHASGRGQPRRPGGARPRAGWLGQCATRPEPMASLAGCHLGRHPHLAVHFGLGQARWRGWPWRGVRVGEASLPGPEGLAATVVVANVTRWSASWRGLLAADPAVVCAQEARIPSAEAEAAAAAARARGLTLHPGQEQEGEHLLAAAHAPAKCQARAEPMLGLSGRHPGRLQHVAVHFGFGRAVHFLNCYGYAGGQSDRERNVNLLIEAAGWLQGLGQAPAFLVGDLNFRIGDSGFEGVLGMAGWRDLLAAAGPTCLPSSGEPSRIDYVLANPQALGLVQRVGLRWDLGIATHAALLVELRAEAPERALLRRPVAPLDGAAQAGWSPAAARSATASVLAGFEGAFRGALSTHDMDAAWATLSQAMRAWLATRMGLGTVPERPHAAAAWEAERLATTGGGGEAADAAADAALLRLRRLRGLRHAQGRSLAANAREVAAATLAALRAADAGQPDWSAALAGLSVDEVLPDGVLEQAEAAWRSARASARSRRQDAWRDWVKASVSDEQGRLYRWIRGGGTLEAELVPDPAVDPAASVEVAGRRCWLLALQGGPAARLRFFEGPWRQLWQGRSPPQLGEDWLQELDGLPAFPDREPWTADLVAEILRRMPRRKKAGLDGWSVKELRLLPRELHG